VPLDLCCVVGPLVAEQAAAVVEISVSARAGFDQHVLVVMANLVTEMTEHRPVRLTEPHPQRLSVRVK
jgi:hypothetical protein